MKRRDHRQSVFDRFAAAAAAQAGSVGGIAVMEHELESQAKAVYHRISPKEAKAIMDSGEAVTVLDVREPYEFRSGHIKNAVLLPSGDILEGSARVLPDKNAKILVYCHSGARSSASARELVKLGYTNVYDFGGLVNWPYNVMIEQRRFGGLRPCAGRAAAYCAAELAFRRSLERGTPVKQSKWMKPLFLALALLLVAAALTACSGVSSAPEAQETQVPGDTAQYHTITPADAKALLDSGSAVTVLDVREQYEYDSGHIQGATLLPSGSVKAQAAEVLPDKDATILVYCRSGARSGAASRTLVDLGYTQVYDLGGISSWPYDVVMD